MVIYLTYEIWTKAPAVESIKVIARAHCRRITRNVQSLGSGYDMVCHCHTVISSDAPQSDSVQSMKAINSSRMERMR